MKVKCIDNSNGEIPLTIGRMYEVIDKQDDFYSILDDDNIEFAFDRKRFELVVEETPIKPEHYNLPITPLEYITKNNLGFIEGNIIKYISRYKNKNGLEDLKKAQEYLNELMRLNS